MNRRLPVSTVAPPVRLFSPAPRFALLFGLAFTLGGCVFLFREPVATEVSLADTTATTTVVRTPVRVHLINGETVIFSEGARISSTAIEALGSRGLRYDLGFSRQWPVDSIQIDSIVAVETIDSRYQSGKSFAISTLATAGGIVVVPSLLAAIFGSCPTIYSDGAEGPLLEAEAFSNSIAPLFEVRDVDRLSTHAGSDGSLELAIRNEALETHYINHLELVEVRHARDAYAVPAPDGQAFVLRELTPAIQAVDRAGREVGATLRETDHSVFRSASETLAETSPEDLFDRIDLTFSRPVEDRAALVLRLRNSLLNTVYFYDYMLAGQGARSLDWVGRDLASISAAVELGSFYARTMGLRVQVWDGARFVEVGKVGEVGPIAFDDVAVAFTVPEADSLRIRLRFVADAWRIDRAVLAQRVSVESVRRIPLAGITSTANPLDPLALLSAPDTSYLITYPGTQFRARFIVGSTLPTQGRTFFIAAQGYYTEWIRRDWLRTDPPDEPFKPSEVSLHAAMRRWQEVGPAFEARFESTRIPIP